jgi:hypothetical protein
MKKFILAIVAMSVFTTAQASFLIEPYLGMHFNSELEAGSSDSDASGIGMGARVGWQNLGLQLGVNYKMTSFEFDDFNSDADYNHMGLFVGYEFPVLIRVWAEYIISSELDFDNGGKYEDASGTTLGFGYTGLPFIALNFEITNVSYEEFNGNSLSGDFDLSTYMLSVSLPLTF